MTDVSPEPRSSSVSDRYASRIAALERGYDRDREAVERDGVEAVLAGTDANERFLREGAGRAIWLYVAARTGGRDVRFPEPVFEALERSMNGWLRLYAVGNGVELDARFTVREAAELLIETRNVHDVAQLLTGVPGR